MFVCFESLVTQNELLDTDAKIVNLNFNGLKLMFYLFIEQCKHQFFNLEPIGCFFNHLRKPFCL
jgi:hypothetical protein